MKSNHEEISLTYIYIYICIIYIYIDRSIVRYRVYVVVQSRHAWPHVVPLRDSQESGSHALHRSLRVERAAAHSISNRRAQMTSNLHFIVTRFSVAGGRLNVCEECTI
jgi:hypothetical protein